MKSFETMTTKDWCSLYATMNMLLKQKVITFDLDKSYVEFHVDEAMTYLENQNVNLQHELEEKDKVIDEIEKRCNQEINAATIQYERNKRNDTWQYIIAHKRILEILERARK